MTQHDAGSTWRTWGHLAGAIGVLSQIATAFSFILIPALTVPPPATYVFVVAWFVLVGLAIAWWRDHPWRSFFLPIASLPIVTAILVLGQQYLGWTA